MQSDLFGGFQKTRQSFELLAENRIDFIKAEKVEAGDEVHFIINFRGSPIIEYLAFLEVDGELCFQIRLALFNYEDVDLLKKLESIRRKIRKLKVE